MKLLIITSKSKLIHLKEFGERLKEFDIEYKLIEDLKYLKKFSILRKKAKNDFENLLNEYKPNFILLDRHSELGIKIIEKKIPLLVTVRGDIWKELKIAKEKNNSLRYRLALKRKEKIIDQCLKKATIILPLSNYLSSIVKEHFPKNKILTFPISSRNSEYWKREEVEKLRHPCVGLVQGAAIWGKTKEMLILPKILQAYPEITFYWAGDGEYKKQILSKLEQFKNFIPLGNISYPDEVKKYVSDIDIFALISGMDSFGQAILEGSLLKKPVLATNVGGIPEIVIHGKTGFLINEGDYEDWIDKIGLLINDQEKCKEMGEHGRKFVEDNFSWNKTAEKFVNILKEAGFNWN